MKFNADRQSTTHRPWEEPELRTVSLSSLDIAELFDDLASSAEVFNVRILERQGQHSDSDSDSDSVSLDVAQAALLGQKVRAVQVRYQYGAERWFDTTPLARFPSEPGPKTSRRKR